MSGSDAVGVQNIVQGHDAFQLVYVSTAHYRQQFELICAHSLECQIKPLVGVDVGENRPAYELAQLLFV